MLCYCGFARGGVVSAEWDGEGEIVFRYGEVKLSIPIQWRYSEMEVDGERGLLSANGSGFCLWD